MKALSSESGSFYNLTVATDDHKICDGKSEQINFLVPAWTNDDYRSSNQHSLAHFTGNEKGFMNEEAAKLLNDEPYARSVSNYAEHKAALLEDEDEHSDTDSDVVRFSKELPNR